MKKRKKNSAHANGRLFVMLMFEIVDAEAWRALSHGAQALYIALRRRYNATTDNNGKIYLPQRVAEKELRSKRDQIVRWFRELQHYGFIVLTSAGYLGARGRGRAPSWRLTELPCNGEPATEDFLLWNGAPFANEKNRIPVPKTGPLRSRKRDQGTVFPKVPLGPENGTGNRSRKRDQI